MTSSGSEVVIVGGGICGCLAAYLLARAGVPVIVIERGGIGEQASGCNSGTLGPLLGAGVPGPLGDMAMAAFRIHQALLDDWGPERPGSFRSLSRLHVSAGEDQAPQLTRIFDQYSRHQGFSAEYLNGAELARLEPRLNPRFAFAVATHGDLAVDGREYTLAIAAKARQAGAVFAHHEVKGFDHAGDRVTAVRCNGRVVSCGALVIAAGPWSAALARPLGCDIPSKPVKGEMLRFASPSPRYDISHNGMSCYGRGNQEAWAGSTNEDAGFDLSLTRVARERIGDAAADLLPDLKDAKLESQTAALRDASVDGVPVCGRIPGWENGYVMAGAGSKGLLLSALMSRTVQELITRGSAPSVAGPADPGRFSLTS
jgi:glycine oxidase